jgi:hypothetical protein
MVYFIGSLLVTNIWYVLRASWFIVFQEKVPRAILHNPELYPDPEIFKPERFLNEDGTFRDDPAISLAFGAGKRICPGRHLVEATLFVVSASVLSVFNVTKARDEHGHEIPVSPAMQSDAISRCVSLHAPSLWLTWWFFTASRRSLSVPSLQETRLQRI